MFDRQALEFLVGLAKTEIVPVNGQKYSTKPLHHVSLETPAPLQISTLTGVVDYIKSNADLLFMNKLPQQIFSLGGEELIEESDVQAAAACIAHVISPTKVKLYSPFKEDMNRDCYISCEADTPKIQFGSFMDMESFNIMLQSCFERNQDVEAVLKIVGNIREESVKSIGDDGVSQSVTAKAGIAKVEEVKVPNPVILSPYRSFSEIVPPESKFVFRMQTGPRAALFEADGGAWRNEAILRIKFFLESKLRGFNVSIIA